MMRVLLLAMVAISSVEAQLPNSTDTNTTGASLDAGLSFEFVSALALFNTRGIPYPDYRYKPWKNLDVDAKENAVAAGCK